MKRSCMALAAAVAFSGSTLAGVQLTPDRDHVCWGFGMAFSKVPFSMSRLKLPLSYVCYDYQFMEPVNPVRVSASMGLYGFEGVVPVPELGTNLYFGSEERTFQGKIGLNGFWDIAVGGHAGLGVKGGLIIKNRFDITLFAVPTGKDSKRSYLEVLGTQTKTQAYDEYQEHGKHVDMPYFGFLFTLRH